MADANWKSTSIPAHLYDHVRKRHVPSRAASVQAYVAFWTRLGTLIDELVLDEDESRLAELRRILAGLRTTGEKPHDAD